MSETQRIRLSAETAETIRKRVAAGERQCDVARDHGISAATVCRIVNGSRHAQPQQTQEQDASNG
jgi:predicted DNA-binding protein (UPF0251 family)